MTLTPKKTQTASRRLPNKRAINFAAIGEKSVDPKLAIPLIVLIVIAAILFGEFAVAGRLAALSREKQEAAALRTEVDNLYTELDELEGVPETYAHYTWADMTEEELTRADRSAVLSMLNRVVFPYAAVEGWTVSGNVLKFTASASTLQEINNVAQLLRNESLVDFCTVTTAETEEISEENPSTTVTAEITVYLNGGAAG